MSTRPASPPTGKDEPPPNNGLVLVLCQIMRQVLASAAEAELGALFLNAQSICSICIALAEMGHPQLATLLQTNNSTASSITNDTVKQKRSKAIDMQFYWLRDWVCQGQFHIMWQPGSTNHADYFSKHNPALHHQAVCASYLHAPATCNNYYACLVNTPPSHPSEGVLIPHGTQKQDHHKLATNDLP